MDASASAITEKLIAHIAQVSGVDPATLSTETLLYDIGLDSILLAIILRGVETEFAIEFGDDEIAIFLGASSIRDYVDILQRALRRQPRA